MTRLQRTRDDLVNAIRTGEVSPQGNDLYQLATDLVRASCPEAPPPPKLCPFSLLVGFAAGAAVQKTEDE